MKSSGAWGKNWIIGLGFHVIGFSFLIWVVGLEIAIAVTLMIAGITLMSEAEHGEK